MNYSLNSKKGRGKIRGGVRKKKGRKESGQAAL